MKFALHARCEKKFLQQADEIIVSYREKERLIDYPEAYPEAAVTVECYELEAENIDFKWLAAMASMFPKGYSVGFLTMDILQTALDVGINAYLLRFITTYAELNKLKDLGVAYIMLGQPLFSSMDKVKKFEIPVRWTPNVVDADNIGLKYDSHGTWIRPEDLLLYDEIPGCIAQFPGAKDYKAEQAFFRVYKKGEWPQDLGNLLLEFHGDNINNYLLGAMEEFGKMRLNCHQRCEEAPNHSGCHYCDNAFRLANTDMINSIRQSGN